jgi:hypothetical protein
MSALPTEPYRTYKPAPFTKAERDSVTILFGGLHWRVERILQAVFESIRQAVVAVMLALPGALPAHAAGLADLPADWKPVSLLRDRLHAEVPRAGEITPAPHGIMEAVPALEEEHLVTVDAGTARLIVHVKELFRTAPSDFVPLGTAYFRELAEHFQMGPVSMRPPRTKNGLDLLESEPRGKATVPGAELIRSVLVRQADDSVQLVTFLLNEPAVVSLPAARPTIDRIIASLRAGTRKLASDATVKVGALTLSLPPGYTAYVEGGIDFSVHLVEHVVPLGQRAGRLGIYIGHHPSRSEAPPSAQSRKARLLGLDATWRAWRMGGSGEAPIVLRQEAYVTRGGRHDGVFHVFFHATSEAERAAFERIAETATVATTP